MHCHVINLDRDKARWAWMERQLLALGLCYSRVPAVEGRALPLSELAHYQSGATKPMAAAEVGALLSHMQAWTAVCGGVDEAGVILEDDLHFSPNFAAILSRLAIDPAALEVLKLEASPMISVYGRKTERSIDTYSIHALSRFNLGAAAYVVNKRTAARLIDLASNAVVPIDFLMFDPKVVSAFGIRPVQMVPAPCVQDVYVPGFLSQNFGTGAGVRQTKEVRRGEPLRRLARPLFRRIMSVFYGLLGQIRAEVVFH
jgi:glycosyl transferase family 25